MTVIKTERLANGLVISFSDQTNRYFGDYHRICVVATISYDLDHLTDETLRSQASACFGEQLKVEKSFQRMGVPSADIADTRNALIDDFMRHAVAYLSRPDYPYLLVAAELRKPRSGRLYV